MQWTSGVGVAGCNYNAEHDRGKLNLVNPYTSDMVTVPPHQWAVIRFVADNPGVWPFQYGPVPRNLPLYSLVHSLEPAQR